MESIAYVLYGGSARCLVESFFQPTGWICKEPVEESVKLPVRHHLAVRTADGE